MKQLIKALAVVACVVGCLLLYGWYATAIWEECRMTNSTLYCMKVISR